LLTRLDLINKKFPFFWGMDEILASHPTMNPPYVVQSTKRPTSTVPASSHVAATDTALGPASPTSRRLAEAALLGLSDESDIDDNDGATFNAAPKDGPHADQADHDSDGSSTQEEAPVSEATAAFANIPTPNTARTLFTRPIKPKGARAPRTKAEPNLVREKIQLERMAIMRIKSENEAREIEIRARQQEVLLKLLTDNAEANARKAAEDEASKAEEQNAMADNQEYLREFEREWLRSNLENRDWTGCSDSGPPDPARSERARRRPSPGVEVIGEEKIE
jgi:hypothetical protein